MSRAYELGLLHLIHLLISADGEVDSHEKEALEKVIRNEGISDTVLHDFQKEISAKTERAIFNDALDLLNDCAEEERLRAFSILYKLAEVDGKVHVKEARLLLYSSRFVHVDFNRVVNEAANYPPII